MFFRKRFSLKTSLPAELYSNLANTLSLKEFEALESLLIKYQADKQDLFKSGGFDRNPANSSVHAELFITFINSMANKLCQNEHFDDASTLLELSFKIRPELNNGHATMALLKANTGPSSESKKHAQQFLFDAGDLENEYGKLEDNPFMTQEQHTSLKMLMAQIIISQELQERLNDNQQDHLMVENLLEMTNGPTMFSPLSLILISESRNKEDLSKSLVSILETEIPQQIVVSVYSMVKGQGLTESILDVRTKEGNFLMSSGNQKTDEYNSIALRLMEIACLLINEDELSMNTLLEKAYEIGKEYHSA